MTLIQLIDHLKQVFHDNGDVDMEVMRVAQSEGGTYEVDMDESDIWVSLDKKTITFT